MTFNRVRISTSATIRLKQLQIRTRLTPNILSRIAICYSLNDPSIPNPKDYDERGMEMNRFTLTGDWDSLFIALVTERCIQDGLDPEKDLPDQLRAHLNRGVYGIYSRIKGLGDIQSLLTHEAPGIKTS